MPITEDAFRNSLVEQEPPPGLPASLRALWFDGKEDWHRAHAEVEDGATAADCQVHGYLHRKEGDTGNAAYWYRRAGAECARGPVLAERDALLRRLLRF